MKKIIILLATFLFITSNAFALKEPSKETRIKADEKPAWADTAYGHRLYEESKLDGNMYGLVLFKPNYALPFFYTGTPDNATYQGQTPDNQTIKHTEFEGQISFKIPVLRDVWGKYSSLNFAYTQLMLWQVYTRSPYFRETNYEPEVFLEQHYGKHWTARYSLVHQSNGRGIPMERSWNRIYAEAIYSGNNWFVSAKPWVGIAAHQSATMHNPDIMHFMGHGRFLYAYKMPNNLVLTLMSRNNLESGFKRGAEEVDFSFPITGHFKGYVRFFSGYGQSLIEYNHYTNAVGIGFVLNDWI